MGKDETIVMSYDIQLLTGKGTEYLLNLDGSIRAKFVDGELIESPTNPNSGDTILPNVNKLRSA